MRHLKGQGLPAPQVLVQTILNTGLRRGQAQRVDPTLALLAERGITATTIEAVAERSGVAKTTIYRQWDRQPELVLDAIGTTVRTPPTRTLAPCAATCSTFSAVWPIP